jgi:hypothetical protein
MAIVPKSSSSFDEEHEKTTTTSRRRTLERVRLGGGETAVDVKIPRIFFLAPPKKTNRRKEQEMREKYLYAVPAPLLLLSG